MHAIKKVLEAKLRATDAHRARGTLFAFAMNGGNEVVRALADFKARGCRSVYDAGMRMSFA